MNVYKGEVPIHTFIFYILGGDLNPYAHGPLPSREQEELERPMLHDIVQDPKLRTEIEKKSEFLKIFKEEFIKEISTPSKKK